MSASAAMREDVLLSHVIELARMLGWRTAHFRPAMTRHGWRTPVQGDGKGFPDLILVRPPRMVVAECKREDGKITGEQEEWLNVFRRLPGVEVHVWRPSGMDAVAKTLSRKEDRMAKSEAQPEPEVDVQAVAERAAREAVASLCGFLLQRWQEAEQSYLADPTVGPQWIVRQIIGSFAAGLAKYGDDG